jgi:hypothetical protein
MKFAFLGLISLIISISIYIEVSDYYKNKNYYEVYAKELVYILKKFHRTDGELLKCEYAERSDVQKNSAIKIGDLLLYIKHDKSTYIIESASSLSENYVNSFSRKSSAKLAADYLERVGGDPYYYPRDCRYYLPYISKNGTEGLGEGTFFNPDDFLRETSK